MNLDEVLGQLLRNLCIFDRHRRDMDSRRRQAMHQHHRKASSMKRDQFIIQQPIRKHQHSICIMRSHRGRHDIAAIEMISCNDQVISPLPNHWLNPIQERDKKVVMEVVEQQTNEAGLSAREMTRRGMRDIFQVEHYFLQTLGDFRRNWGILIKKTTHRRNRYPRFLRDISNGDG